MNLGMNAYQAKADNLASRAKSEVKIAQQNAKFSASLQHLNLEGLKGQSKTDTFCKN